MLFRSLWLWGSGDSLGEFLARVVDVGTEAAGVEEEAQLALFDIVAAVAELGRSTEGNGVGWNDGVKLSLACFAVLGEEVLQLVNEAIGVASSSLIQSQGGIGVGKAGTYA